MEYLCGEQILNKFTGYDKIEEALNNRRFIVIKCRGFKFYVFKGLKKDYIVAPCRFCTCDDFVVNYLSRKRENPCYHVVGFKIAETVNKVVELEVDPKILAKIVEEVIYDGFSSTLRKLLKVHQ
ncbi:MAG: hypothetical protein QW101_02290 [Ignisphaera sp.]|uniref:SWIM-type domain-containing protein n=1 Tax=Ignisphaera aggregans TaxID=334771 RepID=A0A7J3MXL4_9CREN